MGKVNLTCEQKVNFYKSALARVKFDRKYYKKEIADLKKQIRKLEKQNALAHDVIKNYSENGMKAKGKINCRWNK